ncbi:MAG: tRNA preQ1(34) S-adenosylmethionine ribosyltransferase-isomerase QueA [Acidimicrobiia bacterium]|nr:tRNA preQ1(34) S-adenosylmethionine ribosyltransferase-isomerase QueA [Acidimicrobiia bacterium]
MRIEDFDFDLPADTIAQVPAEPRDASGLLVTGDPVIDTTFGKLPDYLRAGDLLVVNTTRVRAARLTGARPTGGAVELLLLRDHGGEWEALARPARKLQVGMILDLGELSAEVVAISREGEVRVRLITTGSEAIEETIARVGTVPYPPYVSTGPADPERYQTVYATATGSAAAPTAGLHFTPELLADLADRGIRRAEVLLDIGLDTFRPITASMIEDHEMHRERYRVPASTVAAVEETRARGGRVVAVGTTTVRALESAAVTGKLVADEGSTELFITPGYQPRVVDALLTNFHMPRSSLMVMIAALLPGWRRVYEHALKGGYRFLSFGDAMLIPDVHSETP